MFLSSWRKLVQQIRRQSASRRGHRLSAEARKSAAAHKSKWLFFEELEERTLLTVAQWNPTSLTIGVGYQWSNSANWISNTGLAPTQAGDIAQFVGTIVSPPTLDTPLSVGEVDFNSPSNVSILEPSGGSNTLTLDNTGFKANAIINALITNTGTDTILVPLANNPSTPLAASISGGVVQLDNLGGSNTFAAGSTFTMSTGGALVVEAPGNTGTATLIANTGGTLTVNANANPGTNLGTIGNVTLGGGTFSFVGSNPVSGVPQDSTLNVGTITLNAGSANITTSPGTNGGSVAMTATALVRKAGGTVDFLGTGLGVVPSDRIFFTQAPTQQGDSSNFGIGILPYAFVNGQDFATYQVSNPNDPGITGIGAFNDYAPSITGGAHGGHDQGNRPRNLDRQYDDQRPLAEHFGHLGSISGTVGEAGFTLTIASGGILDAAPAGTISGGTLAFGGPFTGDPTNEGIIMNGETPGGLDSNWYLQQGYNVASFPGVLVGVFNQYNLKSDLVFTRIDPSIDYPDSGNGVVAPTPPAIR